MRTIVKTIATAAMLLCFFLNTFSQQVAKTIPNSSTPEGLIGFLEFRPSDYGSQKHPLIIFLHGIGERGNGTTQINSVSANAIPYYCARGASMRFTVGGQTSSFVVLSPQLSTQFGYWPPFYVTELIKYAKANLQIDPNRIYLAGLSLGGGGVWRAITDVPNYTDFSFDATIAAAAPVCGTQEENDGYFCNTIGANHLPIWDFHCMDDGTVGVGASQHAEILGKNCGLSPAAKFTYYQSGGHSGAWINAFDTGHITRTISDGSNFTANPNMYEWFLSNTRSTQTGTNTAPVANAGSAQSITLPTSSVTLSGSGSGTNGATISSYAWVKSSGPSSGTIANAGAASTGVTGLVQGTYVFALTVTDNHGLTNTSNVTVTVNAAAGNKYPVALAGSNQTITLPAGLTLDASASYDPDGTIVTYRWTETAGPVGPVMTTRDSKTTAVTGLLAGNYTFVLQVTDNGGLQASTSVNITVNPAVAAPSNPVGNKVPTANAGSNQSITLPATLTLDGSASSDPDGTITAYSWSQSSGPAGATITNAASKTTTVTGLVAGSYVFALRVTDNGGLQAASQVSITVSSGAAGSKLLGYVKLSVGPYQACADASSSGRIAIYGNSLANGSIVYTSNAMTTPYNGGWNWYSFTPTVGAATTNAFAIFPNGSIALLRNCSNGSLVRTMAGADSTGAAADEAELLRLKDSAASVSVFAASSKLLLYPNPVRTVATLELTSADEGYKGIYVYDASGVLVSSYRWQTIKGRNTYQLKDLSKLTNGLYIVSIRDNTGRSLGSVKLLKVQ